MIHTKTTRLTSGAQPPAGPHSSRYALPSSSILPSSPTFERSQFSQALIDIVAVVFGIIFVCSVAVSLPLAVFMMFFASF